LWNFGPSHLQTMREFGCRSPLQISHQQPAQIPVRACIMQHFYQILRIASSPVWFLKPCSPPRAQETVGFVQPTKISHDNQGLGLTMVRRSYSNFERRDFIPSENRCHMCFPLPPNMRHYCMHWYANNMFPY
jgi:hypothetical protein